jgi:hypothetical protein
VTAYVCITWPDGTRRAYCLSEYLLLDIEALEGTRARLIDRTEALRIRAEILNGGPK